MYFSVSKPGPSESSERGGFLDFIRQLIRDDKISVAARADPAEVII